ncbi:MAG: hypothetical protein L3J52_04915 [Proteobacteria bacterium]|nr:hypothetical protein [Pseudomonadota bacterium]
MLFLVFFAVFWFWVLWELSDGAAQWLTNPEGSLLISWLLDPVVAKALFVNRAPTLSVFFLLAVSTIPLFVLFAASDQTANDIGSKYLRFLIPRCNRLEIFIARFIGAVLLVSLAYTIITAFAGLISLLVDGKGTVLILADSLLIMCLLIVYAIPFIALMSLCSVVVGSAGLSALVGISIYTLLLVIISVIKLKMPDLAQYISYLLPNATKALVLKLSWSSLTGATLITPIYILVYGFFGWWVFSKRDI